MTDYDTFAGIFTCQRLAFAHRQSATLLSRNKDLDKMFVDKVHKGYSISIYLFNCTILTFPLIGVCVCVFFFFLFSDANSPWFIQR